MQFIGWSISVLIGWLFMGVCTVTDLALWDVGGDSQGEAQAALRGGQDPAGGEASVCSPQQAESILPPAECVTNCLFRDALGLKNSPVGYADLQHIILY